MSTRSGKRIHGSINESAVDDFTEMKTERKTRGKRHKENIIEAATEKKRRHYVRYPSEEDIAAATNVEKLLRSTRKSQKNALTEKNTATDSETSNDDRNTRRTRRTRKTDAVDCTENIEPSNEPKTKAKKNNRKTNTAITDETPSSLVAPTVKKKSNKKKNKRKSGSLIVEDIPLTNDVKSNTSNMSIDSFHSAAESPVKDFDETEDQKVHHLPSKYTRNVKKTFESLKEMQALKANKSNAGGVEECDQIQDIPSNATRSKLHVGKNISLEITTNIKDTKQNTKLTNEKIYNNSMTDTNDENINNSSKVGVHEHSFQITEINNVTRDKQHIDKLNNSENLNISLKKTKKQRRSNNNSTDDRIENKSILEGDTVKGMKSPDQILNTTNKNSAKKNSTYDKINISMTSLNATYEKDIQNKSLNKSDLLHNLSTEITCVKNSSKLKRNSICDKINADTATHLNATFDKDIPNNSKNVSDLSQDLLTNENSLKDNNKKKRKSSFRKSLSDTIANNSSLTEQKIENMHEKEIIRPDFLSGRFSKFSLDQDVSTNFNTTYDRNSITESNQNSRNNSTYDKSAKFNTTFEMVKKTKLDTSNVKSQHNDSRRGSSLISSDTTDNVISEDISRISVTSDESMAENIVNCTPVLIESSMDESHINVSSNEATKDMKVDSELKHATPSPKHLKDSVTLEEINTLKTPQTPEDIVKEIKTSKTPLKREGTYTEIKYATPPKCEGTFSETKPKAPKTPLKREGTYTELNPTTTPPKNDLTPTKCETITPLKTNGIVGLPPLTREGTFTKEDSDVPESPMLNVNKTPNRRKSLPSPGCTPFPMSRSSSKEVTKEKSMLNVTRSIEKPNRRLSSVELHQKATRVMFCSPVDTPAVGGQKRGNIIKSNLKGSDKSFLFDESMSDYVRPARKRSYTQSEAESISGKRKRLTEDQQQSVERLSRPRTSSASGKLQEPSTPSKKASSTSTKSKTEVTPSKTRSEGKVLRTKLPNFAALHQKRFAKMESLNECQERKAKRAKQLLTPTGSVNILEKISPKETQVLSPPEQSQTKKTDTPKKSIIPSDNHKNYTRFGFKLNLDVNPFSFPATTEIKPKKENKEIKVRPLKRQATLPSLAGATAIRKEAAKQVVLREKSFTEKRDIKRKENRTVIKGVRTNRRFELQMQLRNVK
ncbi:intracellular protein transport protein USO1 isoform X2 [Pararge aegeria]|uniref:intracellular protein transport protein USO1 isoform X2 n=1 Tax=Pararge aegeria TaxID=116150 RepID=UPI0019CFC4E6|nr:intracellular protein transport protein USO1 isoform X2 [Pararge aegeria]